jgi:protein involved in polysaccharide export with SLBB domain
MRLVHVAIYLFSALFLLGCHGSDAAQPAQITAGPDEYIVSGEVQNPGPRPLVAGANVAWVLANTPLTTPRGPMTLVLVRRGPEGKSRQLIPLDAHGKLMDEKQNYALRGGDELVFSTSADN